LPAGRPPSGDRSQIGPEERNLLCAWLQSVELGDQSPPAGMDEFSAARRTRIYICWLERRVRRLATEILSGAGGLFTAAIPSGGEKPPRKGSRNGQIGPKRSGSEGKEG